MDEPQTSELRDLLLHKLRAARAEELESRVLLDTGFGLRLESEENDLLDDFARGRLTAEDAALVERHLLVTPAAQGRLEFARSLSQVAASSARHHKSFSKSFSELLRKPAFSLGLAACVAILSFAIVYVQRQPTPEVSTDQKPPASVVTSRSTEPRTEGIAAQSFAIVLLNENLRGAQVKVSAIPEEVKRLQIQCEIPASNSSEYFGLVIRDEARRQVANLDGLRAKEAAGIRYVEGDISSDQIKSGRYSALVYSVANPAARIVAYDFVVKLSKR